MPSTLAIIGDGLPQTLPRNPEQRLWRVLREAEGPRSYADLHRAAYLDPEQLFDLVERWAGAGLLLTLVQPVRFTMTERARARARPPRPVAPQCPARPLKTRRQAIWTAIKVLKEFDLPTVAMTAECASNTAYGFLAELEGAGFVRAISRPRSAEMVWRLVRHTGPLCPKSASEQAAEGKVVTLTDRNTGESFRFPKGRQRRGKAAPDIGGGY